MYKRKTVDEYQIWTNYGWGWECETIEESWKDAKRCKKEYIENSFNLTDIKIKKVRVKCESV